MTPEQSARHRESAQLRRRLLQLIQRRERSLSTVDLAVRLGLSRVTCWRYLNAMEADGVVSAIGQGRGTRWTTETARSHTERPEGQRPHVNYDFKRLDHYIPNQTFLLDEAARAQLHNLGQRAATRSATEVISRVRSKLLEDMSWASSRLEGNRYSLAETRRLFEDQSSAPSSTTTRQVGPISWRAAIWPATTCQWSGTRICCTGPSARAACSCSTSTAR